jgi:tetratricopeptide (TPR) repeat protein
MKLRHLLILSSSLLMFACAVSDNRGRISTLDDVKIDIKDVSVEGGLDKAMAGYQKFLTETPESALTPEAIRRLADLKIEKEYGVVADGKQAAAGTTAPAKAGVSVPAIAAKDQTQQQTGKQINKASAIADLSESEKAFEKRATRAQPIKPAKADATAAVPAGEPGADLQNANAAEAIVLYKKLLAKYPMYERNDQVLYQLSRAYEEIGAVEEAMKVMNRLVRQYPKSRYIDEVQFRRGEYFFTRKKYLDAEDAYGAVLVFGVGSVYYTHALFKKGWTFYKQQLYEEALDQFIKLLDYQVSIGYDFDQTSNEIEKKRTDDTFRVISLAFSNLGGAQSVQDYFKKVGPRGYEDHVYSNLAEFYFTKRRYSDAASTYNAFVERNPFNKNSPYFSMRVIEIYKKGGFPRLVIEAKRNYASTYGVKAEYWHYFNQSDFPKVLENVKTNLVDLAKYYHSLYQNKKFKKDRAQNFNEASHWYKEFLTSFPKDKQSPTINYQLADLLLENKNFNEAGKEYERTAYDYPLNDRSAKAAYAAVYAYREHLKQVAEIRQLPVKRDIIRSSIRLVDKFPHHEKATIVLGAAVDDLFSMRDYTRAISNGRRLIQQYPNADASIRRGAWLVVAHSSFRLDNFVDAEAAYTEVLALTAKDDKSRVKLVDNLAASIYKQGEQARAKEDYKNAVRHFLRIAQVAPASKIRPTAEYDAAAVLIQVMELDHAAKVLLAFRAHYPGHKLQHDVTKKIAFVYKELERYSEAGGEYERVAAEAKDEEVTREAMLTAAEMYEKGKDSVNALRVYRQFVVKFPKPLEFALETYYKIAMLYKSRNDLNNYRSTLQSIIARDASAGRERTDRTRYLAAQASLVIIEPRFDEFVAMKLVNPIKRSMQRKQSAMKKLIASYSRLVDYKVADVTAASTYYLAEIYYNFNRALLTSEVPKGLSALELEEFKLALEDQAFPFEEKAIAVHEKNVELLRLGVYSPWIDRSIAKLASLVPARFAKFEDRLPYLNDMHHYRYTPPSLIREDTTTIYVENLQFFRYPSQKINNLPMKSAQGADIAKEQQSQGGPQQSGKEAEKQAIRVQPDDSSTVEAAPATAPSQPGSAADTATTGAAAAQEADNGQDSQLLGPPGITNETEANAQSQDTAQENDEATHQMPAAQTQASDTAGAVDATAVSNEEQ